MPLTPPPRVLQSAPDTTRRTRFFHIYDTLFPRVSLRQICKKPEINIAPSTGRKWLHQREELGDAAYRRTRRRSTRLGRPSIIREEILDELLDENDPAHNAHYNTQVKIKQLPVNGDTLQANMSKRRGARRFKKSTTKGISRQNKKERISYGQEFENRTINNFWRYILFTDEKHFRSRDLSNKAEYELRQPSSAKRLQSIREEKKDVLDVVVHAAGSVSYDSKGDLIFYSDPKEPELARRHNRSYPRKSGVETQDEFSSKIQAHKEDIASEPEQQIKGNSMTQIFYTQHILPKHIERIKQMEERYSHQCWLQEDNDSSHGTKSNWNPAAKLRREHQVFTHWHPGNSLDLAPQEAMWLVMVGRLRGGEWKTVAEFKEAILGAWKAITLEQVRKVISEMPERCIQVQHNDGKRIRSLVW